MALQMAHLAEHDYLTGLRNRMLLHDRVRQAISLSRRHMKKVVLMFLDLDGFKHINDSLGHATGDKLLESVAGRLVDCVRGSDTVSRQGGDEFVVLLSEVEQAEDAAITARRMLQAVAKPHSLGQHDLHVTTSIGMSVYPDDGMDAETLIKNADTAMYQAKEQGRDNYQLFNAYINAKALQRIALEHGLRRALLNEEMQVHYQPIFDFRAGRIVGMEALLRWTHPEMGPIPPSVFIPLAESTGAMVPIGTWVLRTACAQAKEWHDAGFRSLSLAVNLSVTQLHQGDLVDRVKQ